jgi:hypothetical protein
MIADSESERLLRLYETTVLDAHHRTLPLWTCPRPEAIFATLCQFDCNALLSLLVPPDQYNVGIVQLFKGMEEGLSQALRWLTADEKTFEVVPTTENGIIEMAGNYCQFSAKYVTIADFHKMYGRGQIGIGVDAAQKCVQFCFQQGHDPALTLLGASESMSRARHTVERRLDGTPDRERHSLMRELRKARFDRSRGRIQLVDIEFVNHPDVILLLDQLFPTDTEFVDRSTDLDGFSLGEFDSYFQALRRWSFCCTWRFIHNVTEEGIWQGDTIPTQHVPRCSFLANMERLTGLTGAKVQAITERLAFDWRTAAPDVFQQPLFAGPTSVSWSTEVIFHSRHVRNLLKMMSRTTQFRSLAATIIGSQERPLLRRIGDCFSRKGKCGYKLATPIRYGDLETDIDFLAYSPTQPNEVLIVEAKAMLAPDEINEVDAATREMQRGQDQVRTAIKILRHMPNVQKRELFRFVDWNHVTDYRGVVVSADGEPSHLFVQDEIPGISFATVEAVFRDRHFTSPQRFWSACKNRGWSPRFTNTREEFDSIRVGPIEYRIPLVIRTNDQDSREQMRGAKVPTINPSAAGSIRKPTQVRTAGRGRSRRGRRVL